MSIAINDRVLADLGPTSGAALWAKRAALVAGGIAALAVAAKISVPMWPSPVPITMGTFAVLTIGAAYGMRLGLVTILGYMLIGALGYDVFASSSSSVNGLAYMMGGTGGFLAGYVLAVMLLGALARRGWDKSVVKMGAAMLLGNVVIYALGVPWLYTLVDGGLFNAAQFATAWDQTLAWGVTPYMIGDALKLGLAALLLPLAWKLVGKART
ncbi:biotin transporter BioY [Oceanibium sediminis]|uniref:biotin transporter BioY n=1 Tax=Oceanibium sediminis TaxID=2026339 RepID=UPI000DD39A1D|nr:biotin transporter BioY [Oceanibium sediminis]